MKTNILLIIVLGLFAQLALVSGNCDCVTTKMKDFDWDKFAGLWYVKHHKSQVYENKLDCIKLFVSRPEGNRTLQLTDFYDISEQRRISTYGYSTDWTKTGSYNVNFKKAIWNGRVCILETDYDRYFIASFCLFDSNKRYAYVAFRSQEPEKATKKNVFEKLKDHNIDESELLEYGKDYCQQVE